MASAGMSCLRWFVFILNLLFWLAGMGVLGVALWLRFDPEVADAMHLDTRLHDFYICVYILIAVGVLMSLLGFLGCLGALRQSQCMLVSFFILLVVVFVAELTCALIAYSYQDSLKQYVEKSMFDAVYHRYHRSLPYTEIIDRLQSGLECCGVHSYKDWLHSFYSTETRAVNPELGVGASQYGRVPASCCNENGARSYPANCGKSFNDMPLSTYETFLHPKGCSEALYNKFYHYLDVIIGLSVGIGAFQLLGMVTSMLLCCCINYRKEQDRKTSGYD